MQQFILLRKEMNSSSSSSSSSSPFEEIRPLPRSVRWIETFLLKGLGNLRNLRVGENVISHAIPVNGINSTLTFVLWRSDPDTLTLSCTRSVIGRDPLDYNCYIKLYITLHNFDERARPVIMRLHQNTIDLHYGTQSYRRHYGQQHENFMKCLVRVIETDDTPNAERQRQEQELFRMTREVFASPDQLIEMAYVLRRPDLYDVYTGRMDPSGASLRSALIANACQYSGYIYDYIRAKDSSEPTMPNVPLTEILSGICHPQPFNEYVCSLLFRVAHRLGLEFLRVLCSAYFKENLNDNSMLDAIVLACGTGDSELFLSAAEYFIGRQSVITSSAEWALQAQRLGYWLQSTLRSVHFRSVTENWFLLPLPEEEFVEW